MKELVTRAVAEAVADKSAKRTRTSRWKETSYGTKYATVTSEGLMRWMSVEFFVFVVFVLCDVRQLFYCIKLLVK